MVQNQKIDEILDQLRARKITVWKAAEMAGDTYRTMLSLIKTHNTPFPLTSEALENEIKAILSHK